MTDIKSIVETIAKKFQYVGDKKTLIDNWSVMKEVNGKMRGDCDDFTTTVLWFYFNQSLLSFIWNVCIIGKGKIYRVKTKTGEWHIVGSIDGLFFDNWSLEAIPKDKFIERTGHTFVKKYFTLHTIIFFVVGLFYRNK